MLGSLGNEADLKAAIHARGWNEYSTIFRMGRVMSMSIDDDTAKRKLDGLIGIQLQAAEPMKIEVRNLRVRLAP